MRTLLSVPLNVLTRKMAKFSKYKRKNQHKIKKSLSSAVINTAGSKEEREAVRGILWFDMWQKRQEANKAFLYIKKSPNPGVLHTPCLFLGCPWAEIFHHTQRCRSEPPSRESLGVPSAWGAFWCCLCHTWIQFLPEVRLFPVIFPLCVCVRQWKMLL